MNKQAWVGTGMVALALIAARASAQPAQATPLSMDRLRVQRKDVFEFAAKPTVERAGDKVTVSFAVQDYCDATVAIEDGRGRILRHLASGVLGPNAPEPFQKDSLKQTVVWDGKDEIGRYVDDKDSLTVRVSLGLKPQLERTLFWSGQRMVDGPLLMRATRAGMLVWFGGFGAQLRLFDHDGNYLRTLYPFPANKIEAVKGLPWQTFPPDNERLPSKLEHHPFVASKHQTQHSLLPDHAVNALAVRDERVWLIGAQATPLALDGSSGGANIAEGPSVIEEFKGPRDREPQRFYPHSAAVSPDGKRMYLAGYSRTHRQSGGHFPNRDWLHGVNVLDLTSGKLSLFVGTMGAAGNDADKFHCPMSVAVDSKGRVYVADNNNHRIQVLDAAGKLVKTLPFKNPGMLHLHPKTDEMWVATSLGLDSGRTGYSPIALGLHALGSLDQPADRKDWPLSDARIQRARRVWDQWHRAKSLWDLLLEIDFHGETPTVWTAGPIVETRGRDLAHRRANAALWRMENGTLKLHRDFAEEADRALVYARAWQWGRPRLAVNPLNGRLWQGMLVWDTATHPTSFNEAVVVDPETGRIRHEAMPTDPIDLRFDWEGRAYLRTYNAITRFDSRTWREIPFDYGEVRTVFHGGGGGGEKPYKASSAIMLPSGGRGGLHNGGMGVSPQGNIVVSCRNPQAPETREDGAKVVRGEAYTPPIWPGRHRGYELHVFDIHGRVRQMDVAPGIGWDNDVHLGRDGHVWLLAASTPYLDGEPYFNRRGCTLMKFVPGNMRTLTPKGVIPLPENQRPNRPFDITRPDAWVEGADWLFGPVGADGHYGSGGSCHCQKQGRFALDYFGRSFAPEVDRFRVVVLDANGNVIVRIGRYGNVDDGKPLIAPDPDPADAHGRHPPDPRPIGGDEVALMHCMNVAVHSDRRLFLSDVGNQCVRSVRLSYHAEGTVALKDVPDGGAGARR